MAIETIPYLMSPCPSSDEESVIDMDMISSEYNDFFWQSHQEHPIQIAPQHFPMAVIDLTKKGPGVHGAGAPVLIEDENSGGGDWRVENGATEFSVIRSINSTLVMKPQGVPPTKKKTHRRSCYAFVRNWKIFTKTSRTSGPATTLIVNSRCKLFIHNVNILYF